jgi:hypothetical protein
VAETSKGTLLVQHQDELEYVSTIPSGADTLPSMIYTPGRERGGDHPNLLPMTWLPSPLVHGEDHVPREEAQGTKIGRYGKHDEPYWPRRWVGTCATGDERA